MAVRYGSWSTSPSPSSASIVRLSSGSSPNSTKSSTHRTRVAVGVDRVVDPGVRAGLLACPPSACRRRRVMPPPPPRGPWRRRAGRGRLLVLVQPSTHPHPRAVAEPGLDVAVVVEVVHLGEQLAELRLRVRRAQDLAGGVERIRSQLALRAHGRLHVEERVTRHGARRVGARCASAATAGRHEQGKSGEERSESKHGSFRFGHDAACLPRGPTQGVAYPDTPQLARADRAHATRPAIRTKNRRARAPWEKPWKSTCSRSAS